MKQRLFRASIIAFVICLLFCSAASAAQTESNYISYWDASITRLSSTTVIVEFSIDGKGIMSQIGATKIEIYKSNGVKVATYNYTDPGYSYLMATNDTGHYGSLQYVGVAGQSYYAIVTLYSGNSYGHDTRTPMTSIV